MSSSNPKQKIQSLVDCLRHTADQEADCAEFDRKVECLAELLATVNAAEIPSDAIPPEIQAHLLQSTDCREEFEALICILKAELRGELSDE
ncbi:MAG: hypothetical protein HY862_10255 [Chloroflexi bacterium]|nr:hypothetical protein [Chloroflexota bacterium]